MKPANERLGMADLNAKQKLFVEEYLVDLNATKAYMRVYECSYETAQSEGCKALGNPKINALISKSLTKTLGNLEITRERILREYSKIAFSDLTDVMEWSGAHLTLKPSDLLPAEVTGAIAEITIKSERSDDEQIVDTFKVKLHDKLKALDVLAKYSRLVETEEKPKDDANVKVFKLAYDVDALGDV